MRTKALILSAIVCAAGVVTTFAQNVYSVNVVGYVNMTLTGEFNLIGNQLDDKAGNLVTNIMKGVPNQTVVYKFNGTGYDGLTYLTAINNWNPIQFRQMTMAPGEGVFVKKPAAASQINLTFVGEVLEGELHNPVPVGFEIYTTMVPQAGGLVSVHNYAPANQDVVYKYSAATGYVGKTWLTALNRWQPAGEPVVEVGEAIFINSKTVKDWVRTFDVQ